MKVISVMMNKGGTSKTTLITNLAGMLAQEGSKVLLIDMDAQGNAAMAFGFNPENFDRTIYDALTNTYPVDLCIHEIQPNIFILPANDKMNSFEFDAAREQGNPELLLKTQILSSLGESYDYVLIDTPPSMGLIAKNVLSVSNNIIIPFVPEPFGVRGLINVLNNIGKYPEVNVVGVLGVKVDSRTILHKEYLDQAKDYCKMNGIKMFETTIPRSITFSNSVAEKNLPATMVYKNKATESYSSLFKELMEQ